MACRLFEVRGAYHGTPFQSDLLAQPHGVHTRSQGFVGKLRDIETKRSTRSNQPILALHPETGEIGRLDHGRQFWQLGHAL